MSLSLNEAPVQMAERQAKRYDLCRVLAPSGKDAQMTAQVPKVSALGGSLTIIGLGELEDSSMMAKRLASRRHYTCAAPEYLSAHGTPHTLSELDGYNCLQGTLGYWRFQEKGTTRHIRVKGNLRCNSGASLVDAALKNLGIIQLPDYYVEAELRAGRLVSVLDTYRAPDDGIWAIYPQNRHLSPKVRLLLDHLAKGLR